MARPLVLLSNDDGYRASGLMALREALMAIADVVVCAPEREQSAASHALSLRRPLRFVRRSPGIFSIGGTPADCVYVALHAGSRVLPRRPDLVVSGINHGVNLGDDIVYSGTVAAAREGALKGLPAIAASADAAARSDLAARVTTDLAGAVLAEDLDRPILLNVNFPGGGPWPIRATRVGRRSYANSVDFQEDPDGHAFVRLSGPEAVHPPVRGSDTEAFEAGAVGVAPLALDLWDRDEQPATQDLVGRAAAREGHRGV